MSVSRGKLKNKYIESYFYCPYYGFIQACLCCKRNAINSDYDPDDVKTWFVPNLSFRPDICRDFIKTNQE